MLYGQRWMLLHAAPLVNLLGEDIYHVLSFVIQPDHNVTMWFRIHKSARIRDQSHIDRKLFKIA